MSIPATIITNFGRAAVTALVWAAAALLVTGCGDDGLSPAPFGDSLLVARIAIPPNYGVHDTFVRDGLAFVCAWNSGVYVYDVGNGVRGGTPGAPALVAQIPAPFGQVHNAWWFHNPNTNERRYLFVGEEDKGQVGVSSSGYIHVFDVSDFQAPAEIAWFHIPGAGTHNFWMDENAEVLYAAFYNAGVVALDVSGDLNGDLVDREISRVGFGDSTFTWGVQLANGVLYASDMIRGFWSVEPGPPLTISGGGNNVPERFTSDLWVHGDHGYTGTWGYKTAHGNALKIWDLRSGAPVLVDSIVVPPETFRTVSDVEVSADGRILMFSAEHGVGEGVYWYDLADPAHPIFIARSVVPGGVHTVTFGAVGGGLYAFAARDPPGPEWLVFDVTSLVP